MTHDDDTLPDDREAMAAEHALGVLGAEERRSAEARVGQDAAFRSELRGWEDRLVGLADEVRPVEPSAELWPRVEASTAVESLADARLVRGARSGGLWNSVGFWRGAAGGLGALAAACLAIAVVVGSRTPPQPVTPAAQPMMVADLRTPAGAPLLVVSYDPVRRMAVLTPMPRQPMPTGRAMELWLIPADGRPRALGMLTEERTASMPMPADLHPMMAGGATLAVTEEAAAGSSTGQPTSTPIAAGPLSRL